MASPSKKFQGQKRHSEDEPSTSHSLTGAGNKRVCLLSTNETEQRSLLEVKLLMTKVMNKLREIPHSNNEFLDYIKSKISKLEEGARKKTTVGVFGKSGVGKSSLINTILGEQDLLPSGTITACTSVIIQVESNTTDSSYTAEIDFIPKEEWEKEVKSLLDVLSQHEEDDRDDDDDDNDSETSTAREKIEAVYGVIRPNASLEELMDKQNFAAIPEFLASPQQSRKVSFTSAAGLSEEINHFTRSDDTNPGQYFWPLVHTVTIKIPTGKDILENIVLIDLPGTGDFNKSRDEMWKKCLSRCATVWIVNDINRAASEKESWKILTSCIKDMAHGGECTSISFICTKSDDIDYRAYMKNCKLKDEDLEIQETQDLEEIEKLRERACILHRNERAKDKVKAIFSKQTEMKTHFMHENFLKVFTVSSKVFNQRESARILSQEDTEIPELWRLLKELNNSIHKISAKDYIQGAHGILSLIQGANSSAEDTLEAKNEVLRILKHNLAEKVDRLKTILMDKYCHLELCLSEGVKESEMCALETADKQVIKTKIKDARGYHRTLEALCKNNGFRRLKDGRIIDLNASLAFHMYKHVDDKFCELFPVDASGVIGETDESVRGMLHRFNIISSDMTRNYENSPISLNLTFIKTQQNKVISKIKNDILQRKKNIYKSLQESIQNAMLPSYQEAATKHGKKSFTARQSVLKTHIEETKATMFKRAKTAMLELFENLTEYIEKTLKEELDDILDHALTLRNGLPLPDVTDEIKAVESFKPLWTRSDHL